MSATPWWLVIALAGCRSSTPPEPHAVAAEPVVSSLARDAPGPWRSCLLDGASPCLSAAPIRVGGELLAWSSWLAGHADERGHGVTECRWVAELPHVLLCGSSDQQAMNPALTRAAIFIENRPGVVVRRDDPVYESLVDRIGGFDLLKRHPTRGQPDLLGYYAALDQACATDAATCADAGEVAMRALLERAWADQPSFVVLAFAERGTVSADEAVSHEILHAQYFTNPAFRRVIEDYWAGLPDAARAAVRATLGIMYSARDEELMQNELQAYALMSGAERSRFPSLVAHRAPLAGLLAARNITPVAVQLR